jgi:hypothetical protein
MLAAGAAVLLAGGAPAPPAPGLGHREGFNGVGDYFEDDSFFLGSKISSIRPYSLAWPGPM